MSEHEKLAPAVRDTGEPNTPLTALVGIVGAVMLFVVVVLLQAFFYHAEQEERQRKVVAVAPEELSQLKAQQIEQLGAYRWVDQGKGVVAIPIDRAIQLLVADPNRQLPPVAPPPSAGPQARPAARPPVAKTSGKG